MNSFGRLFRISLFGESHGPTVGVLLDGCPAGITLTETDFETDLGRRKGGTPGTTPRTETDIPRIQSGVFNHHTTGAPILLTFENANTDPSAYEKLKETPRPGHADFTARQKFGGFNDYRGSGHFSGRLTAPLTAAGIIAKKIIHPIRVNATLTEAGGKTGNEIQTAVKEALSEEDSVGGIIECQAAPMPAGLGEPFFDSLESLLAHGIFAIPAVKGIEFGAGFAAARMKGSQCNDEITDTQGTTATNHAGGINGGISNGNPLTFRVAFKPPSSIPQTQETISLQTGQPTELRIRGRHDACIALRAPVIVEAITAIVLADLLLLEQKIPRTRGEKKWI